LQSRQGWLGLPAVTAAAAAAAAAGASSSGRGVGIRREKFGLHQLLPPLLLLRLVSLLLLLLRLPLRHVRLGVVALMLKVTIYSEVE
jgi:hypothetical protein